MRKFSCGSKIEIKVSTESVGAIPLSDFRAVAIVLVGQSAVAAVEIRGEGPAYQTALAGVPAVAAGLRLLCHDVLPRNAPGMGCAWEKYSRAKCQQSIAALNLFNWGGFSLAGHRPERRSTAAQKRCRFLGLVRDSPSLFQFSGHRLCQSSGGLQRRQRQGNLASW